MQVSVLTKERGKGPKTHDPGNEVDNFIINQYENEGLSFHDIAALCMKRHLRTPRGSEKWYPSSVRRVYLAALKRREITSSSREKHRL